tara:strand:- start:1694 stop:2797 length:1104 start_codon:yes stop_codon:yes gene_type:complete
MLSFGHTIGPSVDAELHEAWRALCSGEREGSFRHLERAHVLGQASTYHLPIVSERGVRLVLADVATLRISDGPPMLRSENARLSGWVYVDIRGRDLRSAVQDMQRVVGEKVKLPPGYSIAWSGQFEFLERATAKLKVVVPITRLIIFRAAVPDLQALRRSTPDHGHAPLRACRRHLAALAAGLQPVGGHGRLHCTRRRGRTEFGVIMLLYLKNAWNERLAQGQASEQDLLDAIRDGAVLRVRPKAMTVAVILAGLFPIMWGSGTGSEVMQRIAAPMGRGHDFRTAAVDVRDSSGVLAVSAPASWLAVAGCSSTLVEVAAHAPLRGRLAKLTGCTVPTIRHYEEIGLLPVEARNDADSEATASRRGGA